MSPWSWSARELVTGLKPWRRVVLGVCLCALMVPLWFAAKNTYRFVEGHRTKTEGEVRCEWDGPCEGEWILPGGQYGAGGIEGLDFAADEEAMTDIPLFAGPDWAVTDRSRLLCHATLELVGSGIGTTFVLWVAWARS
ncbi:hypothetical protein ACFWBB_00450 [Streptomyces sp. NPDC060000]|uniref:hypothetical protein n=1 Tax=Streptomyces sp. NPDC060000 TaxID=3347031 RepID=UPI00367A1F06